MTPQQRVIARARAEVGYLEKATNSQLDDKTANAGRGNFTKYARDLDKLGNIYNGKKNGYSWCDVFVDWNFITEFGVETAVKMLYQPLKGLGAGVRYSADYYRQNNAFYLDPQPGDQIFFKSGDTWTHTGLVVDVKDGKVYTVEGNTSSVAGVVSNGGGVREKSYVLNYSKIAGYGRPNWSLVKYEGSSGMDISALTDEQVLALARRIQAVLGAQSPSAWSADARAWAESTGLIQGDETGDKQYKAYVTREQLAQILFRLHGEQ